MDPMKSKTIKTRNLPAWTVTPRSVSIKPVAVLCLMVLCGFGLLFIGNFAAGAGLVMMILGLFSLFLLPDRLLLQASPDYLVLYNSRDVNTCFVVYWDEIVTWQYEYHKSVDQLVISLVDGTTQSIDMFRKSAVSKYMNLYAPGKEVKSSRIKEKA